MGVIRGKRDFFGYGVVDDMEHIIEPVSSSDNESVTGEAAALPRRRGPKQRPAPRDTSMNAHVSRRRKGHKQARRCEGLRELISMVESEDLELDFNMFEPSMSVFAELFAEKEKMQVWNEFVSSTEEQQEALLNSKAGAVSNTNRPVAMDTGNENCLDDSWEHVDKRETHPSFSAEECFQRIDKNIRLMLKRRHRPMGMLVNLEEDIVNFFKEWPQSVYVSKLSNSYERMMLHALCQYLELISKSFDNSGTRQTQVENPQPSFNPPPVLLTQYLEENNRPEIPPC